MKALPEGSVRVGLLAVVLTATLAHPAAAQIYLGGPPGPRPWSVELSGGVLWMQGSDFGTATAELTRNPGTGSNPLDLFTASTSVDATVGAHARVGVYLARSVSVEGGLRYSRPVLSTSLSGDAEGANAITVSETINRYVIDGALTLHLWRLAFGGGRGVPFLSGGAGYVRELHANDELVETARQYHAGAGVKVWLGRRGRVGLRGDVGVEVRDGGFDSRDELRTVPTAGASLLFVF